MPKNMSVTINNQYFAIRLIKNTIILQDISAIHTYSTVIVSSLHHRKKFKNDIVFIYMNQRLASEYYTLENPTPNAVRICLYHKETLRHIPLHEGAPAK